MLKKKKFSSAFKIVFSFLIISLIGCFLLCLPISHNDGKWFSAIDGFFTSVSAVCVTGLTVVDVTINFTLFGKIVLLFLIQIGGLGFITINSLIFLVLGKKITFEKRLTLKEAYNQETVQGMVKFVKKILIFVFFTELLGALCFMSTFIKRYGVWDGFFKSLFMSISSFCNAGFDILGDGVNAFTSLSSFAKDPFVLVPAMLLTILGGIGFIVIFEIPKIFKKQKVSLHSKIALTLSLLLIVGGAGLFAILEWNNPLSIGKFSVGEKILNSFFMSVTPRTVGYSTIGMQNLTSGSAILTIVLMFIGGGSASTAGGIKITTLFLILLFIFKKSKNNGDIVFNKQQIGAKVVRKALKIFGLYILLTILSTIILCFVEKTSVEASLFESISALSTVGLSFGITSMLTIIGKMCLIILMIIGRVGIITMTIAILDNDEEILSSRIEYAEAKILVG